MHNQFPIDQMHPNLEQLKGISLKAAVKLCLATTPKSEDEIGAEMGWTPAQQARFFTSKDYWPALPNLPRLCRAVGNHTLPLWVIANADFLLEESTPMDAVSLFRSLGDLFGQMGALAQEATAAMEDKTVDQLEAKRLLRRMSEIFSIAYIMVPRLQATINASR